MTAQGGKLTLGVKMKAMNAKDQDRALATITRKYLTVTLLFAQEDFDSSSRKCQSDTFFLI